MTATIIPFPDRMAEVAAAAASAGLSAARPQSFEPDTPWYRTAHRVLDHVDDLLEREQGGSDVVTMCERATWCLLAAVDDIDEPSLVVALLARLRDQHLRPAGARPDPVDLAGFVYDLVWRTRDVPPATAIAPYLPFLGRLGVAELRRRLAADEQRLVRAGGAGLAARPRPVAPAPRHAVAGPPRGRQLTVAAYASTAAAAPDVRARTWLPAVQLPANVSHAAPAPGPAASTRSSASLRGNGTRT